MVLNIVVKRERHEDGSISCNYYDGSALVKSTYTKKNDLFEISREELLGIARSTVTSKIVYPDKIETHQLTTLKDSWQTVDTVEILDAEKKPIFYNRMRNLYFARPEEDDSLDDYYLEPNRDMSEYSIFLETTETGFRKRFSRLSQKDDDFNPIYVETVVCNNGALLIEYVTYIMHNPDARLRTMGTAKYFDEKNQLIKEQEFSSSSDWASTQFEIDPELTSIVRENVTLSVERTYEYNENGDLVKSVERYPNHESELVQLYSYVEL